MQNCGKMSKYVVVKCEVIKGVNGNDKYIRIELMINNSLEMDSAHHKTNQIKDM